MNDITKSSVGTISGGLADWTRKLRKTPHIDVDYIDAIDANAADSEVAFAAEHVRRYIASKGQDDGWDGPRPIVILYTKGKKTGRMRRHPLLCLEHGDERFVIGSSGGEDHDPAWMVNLRADPRVHVRFMAALYEADAEVLGEVDRAAVWPELIARYPMFAEYQKSTARQIPIVRLVAREAKVSD